MGERSILNKEKTIIHPLYFELSIRMFSMGRNLHFLNAVLPAIGAGCLLYMASPEASAITMLESERTSPRVVEHKPLVIKACISGSCTNHTATHPNFTTYDDNCQYIPDAPFLDLYQKTIDKWECVSPDNPNYVFAYSCSEALVAPCWQNNPIAEPSCPNGGCTR